MRPAVDNYRKSFCSSVCDWNVIWFCEKRFCARESENHFSQASTCERWLRISLSGKRQHKEECTWDWLRGSPGFGATSFVFEKFLNELAIRLSFCAAKQQVRNESFFSALYGRWLFIIFGAFASSKAESGYIKCPASKQENTFCCWLIIKGLKLAQSLLGELSVCYMLMSKPKSKRNNPKKLSQLISCWAIELFRLESTKKVWECQT